MRPAGAQTSALAAAPGFPLPRPFARLSDGSASILGYSRSAPPGASGQSKWLTEISQQT